MNSVEKSKIPTQSDIVVEFEGARKTYGTEEVIKGVDLCVRQGEPCVIVGPSGCGKSTLLRCVNGLETLSAGRVTFNGTDLTNSEVDLAEVRRRIGIVFQEFSLFPHLTVLDNLTIAARRVLGTPKSAAEDKARNLLERVGVSDKAENYPRQLSGGQQQRVAISRALMMDPEVMLFDEVTSALDPELVGDVLDVMGDLAEQGMTMLIVTHEMGFARDIGKHLVFMDSGVVVEEGDPREVLDAPRTERLQKFVQRISR